MTGILEKKTSLDKLLSSLEMPLGASASKICMTAGRCKWEDVNQILTNSRSLGGLWLVELRVPRNPPVNPSLTEEKNRTAYSLMYPLVQDMRCLNGGSHPKNGVKYGGTDT